MEVATFIELGLGAILTGALAYLFHRLKELDKKDYLTREQIEKLIYKETRSLQDEFDKVEMKIDNMSEQIIAIGVTIARIDERMKRD